MASRDIKSLLPAEKRIGSVLQLPGQHKIEVPDDLHKKEPLELLTIAPEVLDIILGYLSPMDELIQDGIFEFSAQNLAKVVKAVKSCNANHQLRRAFLFVCFDSTSCQFDLPYGRVVELPAVFSDCFGTRNTEQRKRNMLSQSCDIIRRLDVTNCFGNDDYFYKISRVFPNVDNLTVWLTVGSDRESMIRSVRVLRGLSIEITNVGLAPQSAQNMLTSVHKGRSSEVADALLRMRGSQSEDESEDEELNA
ncbi:hypothetical protein LTR36_004848 [Oleoguttula mirabilis]|uniref:F-box domain-containing protein n=1 Tax=Oleoguttula mirabilis TaxID=1507867 RepID=A0AAV9JES1_9PEZI|nr:hypothetical protein LTR36_004848 [Oleoguttula mirabilis]